MSLLCYLSSAAICEFDADITPLVKSIIRQQLPDRLYRLASQRHRHHSARYLKQYYSADSVCWRYELFESLMLVDPPLLRDAGMDFAIGPLLPSIVVQEFACDVLAT